MVKPERTSIDWIVEAENVVLARPSRANPFAFDVTQVLAGDAQMPPINHLVDSATRAKAARNPSHEILFAYHPDEGWRRLTVVDDSFSPLLWTALDHRMDWRSGMPQSRLDFIASLQDSPNPVHKALVIAELDKVPYAQLREFDVRIETDELLDDLWTLNGYQYQAIRALLLGLSGDPVARAEIQDYIDRVEKWGWADNLGAFAAAYIELEGVSGVEDLSRRMLLDPQQPLDKLEQLVMALSVHHALADAPLKAAIQTAIRQLVAQRPKAGVIVARQFSLRSDWSQADVLQPLVRERAVSLSELMVIAVYVARGRENSAEAGNAVFE
jgi:hypothetical protein